MAISKNKAHSIVNLLHIAVLLFLSLAGCVKPSNNLCNDHEPLSQPDNFCVGAAIDQIVLTNDSAYRHLFLTHFTSATAENIFKPAYLHPDENTFNWSEANEFIKFCRDNGKRVHGHTLIWHQQNPQWMVDY